MSHVIMEFQGEYRFLSNFYPVPIGIPLGNPDGTVFFYPTVEHAYQAAKTLHKEDRVLVMRARTPGFAKRLGRQLTLQPDWDKIKLQVMEELVRRKFERDDTLQRQLLNTCPKKLVEGNNWHDTFWGVDIRTGEGENHLGKILMKIRDDLLL